MFSFYCSFSSIVQCQGKWGPRGTILNNNILQNQTVIKTSLLTNSFKSESKTTVMLNKLNLIEISNWRPLLPTGDGDPAAAWRQTWAAIQHWVTRRPADKQLYSSRNSRQFSEEFPRYWMQFAENVHKTCKPVNSLFDPFHGHLSTDKLHFLWMKT